MEEDTILTAQTDAEASHKSIQVQSTGMEEAPKPRRRRGRPRKKNMPTSEAEHESVSALVVKSADMSAKAEEAAPPKPSHKAKTAKKAVKNERTQKRRTTKKASSSKSDESTKAHQKSEKPTEQVSLKPSLAPLQPAAAKTATTTAAALVPASTQSMVSLTQHEAAASTAQEVSSGSVQQVAATKLKEPPTSQEVSHPSRKTPAKQQKRTAASHEVPTSQNNKEPATQQEQPSTQHEAPSAQRDAIHHEPTSSFDGEHSTHRRRHVSREYTGTASTNGVNGGGSRSRHNRRKAAQERIAEPSLTRDELSEMKVTDLRSKAAELDVDYVGMRKKDLIEAIYNAAAAAEGFLPVDGILQMQPEGYAFLRSGNFTAGDHDAFVHQQIIRQYGLRAGDRIKGTVGPARSGNKFPPLQSVELVNDQPAEKIRHRPRFRDLTPIYPNERLVMEHGKDSITGRAIDLVAPIGKGQRGLIVSPPKAGKTTVLKKICQSIAANNPEVHLFCLLVDERPEEVTDMQRSIKGDVVASTFDMPASNHTAVAEMVIEHAKRLVELGEDVVVVLDSITRLARAYNLAQPASGRILSGGVDSAALYPPKKFLGAARNIEGGGSLTILASALVDTGSKMDEVIFEEFKGTGNMELKLDRDLADRRIFPAIDPVSSGTRNEDLLLDEELTPFIWGIRRVLANMNNTERAATALVRGLKQTNTNKEFLIRSAKKAQQSDYIA